MRTSTLLIATLVSIAPTGASSQLTLPAVLAADASRRGCEQFGNAGEFRGLEGPLYAWSPFGEPAAADSMLSAAYWCRPVSNQGTSLLILWSVPGQPTAVSDCPREVRYWNPPAALRIERGKTVSLIEFRPVLDPERFGPDVAHSGPAIVSSNGDTEAWFVCSGGKWYTRLLD